MKPPKSLDEQAARGESVLDSLRSHGDARGADQSTISDILAGRRSTLDAVSAGDVGRRAPPRSHLAIGAGPTPEQPAATPTGIRLETVKQLGTLIRSARQKLGFTQQRFADIAGVGRRFVSELESGKPTLEADRVLRCCAAAGIDIFARPRSS